MGRLEIGEYRSLLDAALLRLAEAVPLDLRPVKGRRDVYRIRVGKYRVLFRRFSTTVLVFRISPRGDAYK